MGLFNENEGEYEEATVLDGSLSELLDWVLSDNSDPDSTNSVIPSVRWILAQFTYMYDLTMALDEPTTKNLLSIFL